MTSSAVTSYVIGHQTVLMAFESDRIKNRNCNFKLLDISTKIIYLPVHEVLMNLTSTKQNLYSAKLPKMQSFSSQRVSGAFEFYEK